MSAAQTRSRLASLVAWTNHHRWRALGACGLALLVVSRPWPS
jgi:hypothetical protein